MNAKKKALAKKMGRADRELAAGVYSGKNDPNYRDAVARDKSLSGAQTKIKAGKATRKFLD